MTASIDSITRVGTKDWKYEWSGTSPFRLYLDGKYLEGYPVSDTSRVFIHDDAEEPPPLEVLDATQTGDPENITNPPILILQWRECESASYYRVEEYVGSTWTLRRTIRETERGYYKFQTTALDDVTTATWRVVAVDDCANETTLSFEGFIVRNPEPPRITIAWDQANTEFDITARA